MRTIQDEEFGKIIVRQIPLPEGIKLEPGGIYTYTGRVAVQYRIPGEDAERLHIATVNDDGTGWHEIFDGLVHLLPDGNGLRFMPFPDNQRALLGDYVFECEPDMDTADPALSKMVPVHYPDEIKNMPYLWKVWSEIIISPDNEHIGWNGLGASAGVYVGKLCRGENEYFIDDVQTISGQTITEDKEHPGCVVLGPMRGGEIKQFTRGGLSVSMVGNGRGAGGSVEQALDSEDFRVVTNCPGYDETTIFSPDNRLGVTMTTRFSPETSSAFLGLIPRRGNDTTKHCLTSFVYMYGVAEVRQGKEGNVGPALIDISRSVSEEGYLGVNLSDPSGEWVYYSPMSWHPSSKKLMWNEGQKKTIGDGIRLSIAELPDYVPGETIPASTLPENIPYAYKGVDLKGGLSTPGINEIKLAGKYSGYVTSTVDMQGKMSSKTVYENFSDDGKSFLNGWESASSPGLTSPGDSVYDAKLKLTGEHTGEMDLHIIYRLSATTGRVTVEEPRGFARYDDEVIKL